MRGRQGWGAILLFLLSSPLWGKPNLTISGSATFSYHSSKVVSGSGQVFASDNYFLSRKFNQYTSLHISGELMPRLKIEANISDYGFSNIDNTWVLTYEAPFGNISVGDMNVSLGPGPLALFNRRLQGVKVEGSLRKGEVEYKLVGTRIRAGFKVDVIRGQDSTGPYYLSCSPVVDGSEVVKVDERVMVRGVDYTIDYLLGVINFSPVNIIPSTSTIVVSYEYVPGRQGGPGTIVGFEVKGLLGRGLSGTLAVVEQKSKAVGGTMGQPREEVEDFFGADSPGPYFLAFRPIERWSERVTVDGVLQERDRDYTINYETGMIMFTKLIPSSSTVVVRYRYLPGAGRSSPGRRVVGIELTGKLGEGLSLALAAAFSQGTAPSETIHTGRARFNLSPSRTPPLLRLPHRNLVYDSEWVLVNGRPLVRGRDYFVDYLLGEIRLLRPLRGPAEVEVLYRYRQPSPPSRGSALALVTTWEKRWRGKGRGFSPFLKVVGTLSRVTPGYRPIDNVAYSRNQTGLNLNASYAPSPKAQFSLQFSRQRLEHGIYGVGTFGPRLKRGSMTSLFSLGATLRPSPNLLLSLSHRINSASSPGGESTYGQSNLRATFTRGGWRLLASLSLTSQNSLLPSPSEERPAQRTRNRTLRAQLQTNYSLGEWLQAGLGLAFCRNNSLSGGGRDVTSRSLSLSLTCTPRDWISGNFSLNLNEAKGGVVGSSWYGFSSFPSAYYYPYESGYGIWSTPSTYSTTGIYGSPWESVGGAGYYESYGYGGTGWGEEYGRPPWGGSPHGWRGRRIKQGLTGRGRNYTSNLVTSIQITPSPKFSLSLGFDAQVYRGASLMGEGWSRDFTLAAGYGLSRDLDLNLMALYQQTFYADLGGLLTSRIYGISLDYRPPRKPQISLNYQIFKTESPPESAFSPAVGGASYLPGARMGGGEGLSHELFLRLSYPLRNKLHAFVEYDLFRSRGEVPLKRGELSAGLEYELPLSLVRFLGNLSQGGPSPLRVVLRWQRLSYRNLRNPDESYKASIFGLQLAARF